MNQQNKLNYYNYIDLAKGIGIMLVVLGHGMFPCHYAIDVFHMPLFFFLAGMTFKAPTSKTLGVFILKKINRIFIPFIFFSLLSSVFDILYGQITNTGNYINGPLWFFQTIFISIILYAGILICIKNKTIVNVAIVFIMAISYLISKYTDFSQLLPFTIPRVFASLFFIHLGHISSRCISNFNNNKSIVLFVVSTILFFVGLFISLKHYSTEGLLFMNASIYTFCFPLFLLCSFSGILCTIFLSKIVGTIKPINWLGKNSLVILGVHFPIVERLNIRSLGITPPVILL